MVALSVSISAITSPEETVSPSFTCHLARTPSSIVGERAGMRMSVIAGLGRSGAAEVDQVGAVRLPIAPIEGFGADIEAGEVV